MSKHDGSWRASLDGHGAYSIDSQDGQVCFVRDPRCARMVAASPDLLEALINVVAISDRKHDAWDAAHAAIAKATQP